MEFTDCHFTYAGKSSREYGLILANCNTSRNLSINGSTKTISVFSERGMKKYYAGDDMTDSSVNFEAEIFTDDERILTPREVREIEQWLFNRKGYFRLYIDPADDCWGESYRIVNGETVQFYINCRMINPSRVEGNGGIAGFRFTVEADSCAAWQDPVSAIFTEDSFSIDIDTDMNEYVYPRVIISMGSSGGDVTITNETDSAVRITGFTGLTAEAQVIIDGNTNYVSGENYTKFSDRNFVRLLPGENDISLTGDIGQIEFIWQGKRYL